MSEMRRRFGEEFEREAVRLGGKVAGRGGGPVHDLVDPPVRQAKALGESVLADPQGVKELLKEGVAGMNRWESLAHPRLLAVVGNLYIDGVAPPHLPH